MRTRRLALIALTTAAIAGLAAARGLATGDPLAPVSDSLEELLASALRQNPEVLVAESRVAEAQAELNQARLAVTQQVVKLHFERQALHDVIQAQQMSLARARQRFDAGSASDQEVHAAAIELAQAEGNLAKTEAGLRYAIGMDGAGRDAWGSPFTAAERQTVEEEPPLPPRPPVPEAMARLLDGVTMKAHFESTPLAEVVDTLAQAAGIDILLAPGMQEGIEVTLQLRKEMSLRKVIQAIADHSGVHFACREYGLLAVWPYDAPREWPLVPEYTDQ